LPQLPLERSTGEGPDWPVAATCDAGKSQERHRYNDNTDDQPTQHGMVQSWRFLREIFFIFVWSNLGNERLLPERLLQIKGIVYRWLDLCDTCISS
jgi:hypothetical protein